MGDQNDLGQLHHGAMSILSQHVTVNFHRFHSLCLKVHCGTLLFNDVKSQHGAHVCNCHSTKGRALYCRLNYATASVNVALGQLLSVMVTV